MPGPLSETLNSTESSIRAADSDTRPPFGENAIALASRLKRIWRIRLPSATKPPMSAGISVAS